MNRIQRLLDDDAVVGAQVTKAPRVYVRVGYSGRWSRPAILALVDTGSPVTIIAPDLARRLGWQQPAGEPPFDLGGLGGGRKRSGGWLAIMDIAFVQSPAQEPTLGILLSGSRVCISDLIDSGSVLIGQHDALERLRFRQRNQEPFWDFELALPDTQEP